ncbi:hypothetical protein Hanom_Chr13g01230411 [Helianthus anomalus]
MSNLFGYIRRYYEVLGKFYLIIRCIAVPYAQYILVETDAQHNPTYVITVIKLITYQC